VRARRGGVGARGLGGAPAVAALEEREDREGVADLDLAHARHEDALRVRARARRARSAREREGDEGRGESGARSQERGARIEQSAETRERR
jgi:hypothetical protein